MLAASFSSCTRCLLTRQVTRRLSTPVRSTQVLNRSLSRQPPRRRFALKTGGAKKQVSAAAAESESTNDNFLYRNPGYFGLAFAFMIFGWFYRSGKDRDNAEALSLMIRERRIIAPSEINFLRRSNGIRAVDLEMLQHASKVRFPDGKATVREFDQFLIDSLAAKFPTGMKYGYTLERVLLSLPKDEQKRSDISVMLAAFSLVVGGDFQELINMFHRTRSGNGAMMSNSELEAFIDDLMVTDQLPTDRAVVPTVFKYPYQQSTIGDGGDLVRKALLEKDIKATLTANDGIEPLEAYNNHAEEPNEGWISLADFKVILASNAVCIWGECYGKTVTQRKPWRKLGLSKKAD